MMERNDNFIKNESSTVDGSLKNLNTEVRISLSQANPMVALSVSEGIDALLGYRADDFLTGKVTLQSRIHAHDQDIAEMLFSKETNPASATFNIRLRHADGRIRCFKGQYTKKVDNTGNGILLDLLLQDAKNLWQQQGDQTMMVNFKAMMENTNDYIYFKDRNHAFTGASQTLVAITDPSEHWTDLIGKTDYDVFPEEYADIYYSLEKQVFAGIHVAHEEQEYVGNDGNKGWVDNRKYPIGNDVGEIIGLFGIARDITEQKMALITNQVHWKFPAEGVLIDENIILHYLENVLLSPLFVTSPKLQKLLKYLVEQSYAGDGHRLKGYTIAIEALGADASFDSNHDSSFRVLVVRLRDCLSEYYFHSGDADEVRFHLPKGKYEIAFLRKFVNTSD